LVIAVLRKIRLDPRYRLAVTRLQFFTCALVPFAIHYIDREICIITAKKALKERLFKLIFAALISAFFILLMLISRNEWIQPAY